MTDRKYWIIRANDSVECVFCGQESEAQAECDKRAKEYFITRWRGQFGNEEKTFREFRRIMYWRIAETDVVFGKKYSRRSARTAEALLDD